MDCRDTSVNKEPSAPRENRASLDPRDQLESQDPWDCLARRDPLETTDPKDMPGKTLDLDPQDLLDHPDSLDLPCCPHG